MKDHRTHSPAAVLDADEAAAALQALGSVPRLAVLRQLVRAGEAGLPVGILQQRLGLPASTLSHHLRALIAAGLVAQRRQGRVLLCSARYDRVAALAEFLISECCADTAAVPVGAAGTAGTAEAS